MINISDIKHISAADRHKAADAIQAWASTATVGEQRALIGALTQTVAEGDAVNAAAARKKTAIANISAARQTFSGKNMLGFDPSRHLCVDGYDERHTCCGELHAHDAADPDRVRSPARLRRQQSRGGHQADQGRRLRSFAMARGWLRLRLKACPNPPASHGHPWASNRPESFRSRQDETGTPRR